MCICYVCKLYVYITSTLHKPLDLWSCSQTPTIRDSEKFYKKKKKEVFPLPEGFIVIISESALFVSPIVLEMFLAVQDFTVSASVHTYCTHWYIQNENVSNNTSFSTTHQR